MAPPTPSVTEGTLENRQKELCRCPTAGPAEIIVTQYGFQKLDDTEYLNDVLVEFALIHHWFTMSDDPIGESRAYTRGDFTNFPEYFLFYPPIPITTVFPNKLRVHNLFYRSSAGCFRCRPERADVSLGVGKNLRLGTEQFVRHLGHRVGYPCVMHLPVTMQRIRLFRFGFCCHFQRIAERNVGLPASSRAACTG
jgi:hypothetical protein